MSHARVLNPKVAMWLPAAILLTAGLLAATGFGIVPKSNAASTGTTTVGATVGVELHVGTGAGQCGGASLTGVTMGTADGTTSLGTCTLTFGTNNNATGAMVHVESTRPAGANSFCTAALGVACGASTFTDVAHTGAASLTDGQYGVRVTAVNTCTTPTWTATNYYGIRNAATAGAGDLICDQTNTTDGDLDLDFSANPAGSTAAGSYVGDAVFTVSAS